MPNQKVKIFNKFLVTIVLAAVFTFGFVGTIGAETVIDFGSADSFAVLAGSGIENTGLTTINGDVGSFPTLTQNGFGSVTLNGTNHFGDVVTQGAKTDLTAAYIDAAGRGPTTPIAADLGGQTLPPGIYKDNGAPASLSNSGTLTLDGGGDANAIFIFQSATTLTTASASVVELINGAKAENVFWQVGSSATLGANSTFKGNIIALTSITLITGAEVEGRMLARNGAVTLDANVITVPFDTTPPVAISDLALSGATTSSIVLTCTAPGDDVGVGTAALYDIRYSTSPIVTPADFTGAALVSGEPVPTAAGTSQTKTVSGLSANTLYYFAMKTQDEVPNVSDVSNIPSLSTAAMPDIIPPVDISDLALSGATTSSIVLTWTAPGDDVDVGTAALYDIRYSTSPIVTPADFTGAALVSGEPVPTAAGTSQTKTVSGLSANTLYYFAMKTQDEVPNVSDVSNIPSLSTVALNPEGMSQLTGTINVVKTVINDNGGIKTVADFPLFINEVPVDSGVTNHLYFYSSGLYTMSETTDPGYTQTFSGDCGSSGQLYLYSSDKKFCIITNDDIGVPVVAPPVPPLIDVVKVPSPLALPDGPGLVTYTYTLRNVGTVPVTDITMVVDTCSPIVLDSGDINGDAKLDLTETWVYKCAKIISETHTNIVVVTGWANGLSATDIASATVVVGDSIIPPLIHVTKVPSPLTLLAGGGSVTYTETITNPGTVALNNVALADDKCSPMKFISGDTNNDSKLDVDEAWKFTCQTNLTKTTTNTATASGEANGLTIRDFALTTVVVAAVAPVLPSTGLAPEREVTSRDLITLAGLLILVTTLFAVRLKHTSKLGR